MRHGDDYRCSVVGSVLSGAMTSLALNGKYSAKQAFSSIMSTLLNSAAQYAYGSIVSSSVNEAATAAAADNNGTSTDVADNSKTSSGQENSLPRSEEKKTIMRITRTHQTEYSTLSEWEIEGTDLSGYSLERGGPSSRTPNDGHRILPGKYGVEYKYSPYSKQDRLFLTGVKGKTGIMLHEGNWRSETDGCLLIGKTHKLIRDDVFTAKTGITSKQYSVFGSSRDATKQVYNYFKQVGYKNVKVIINEKFK